jgi:hypothetical protein
MERKVTASIRKPKRVVERNIALLGDLMQFLLADPRVLASLPSDFELVILPDDDPEMRVYNLNLLDTLANQDKPIVFARLKSSKKANWRKTQPSLYVPLAV